MNELVVELLVFFSFLLKWNAFVNKHLTKAKDLNLKDNNVVIRIPARTYDFVEWKNQHYFEICRDITGVFSKTFCSAVIPVHYNAQRLTVGTKTKIFSNQPDVSLLKKHLGWFRMGCLMLFIFLINVEAFRFCEEAQSIHRKKKAFIDVDHSKLSGVKHLENSGISKCKNWRKKSSSGKRKKMPKKLRTQQKVAKGRPNTNTEIHRNIFGSANSEKGAYSCFYEEEHEEKNVTPTRNLPPSHDESRREIFRLTTFKNFPQESIANCSLLARAGFYYTGVGDIVKCFSCFLETSAVISSNPFDPEMHRLDCDHIAMRECGDVPIAQIQSDDMLHSSANVDSFYPRARSQLPQRRSAIDYPATSSVIAQNTQLVHESHDTLLRRLDLSKEADRMRTFDTWPSNSSKPTPRALARSGFFYLGNSDRTQCFSCAGILKDWSSGDNVAEYHLRYFSHCEMALGRDRRNIPEESFDATQMQDIGGGNSFSASAEEERLLLQRYPCMHPKTPEMVRLDRRIRSFPQWNYTQASVRMLAEAGFFYLGVADRTKCFYCDGGLHNWNFYDEPWREHAKWFPSCQHLLRHKGQNYVENVISQTPNLDRPVLSTHGRDVPQTSNALTQRTPQQNFPRKPHLRSISSRIGFHSEASTSSTLVQNQAPTLEETMRSEIANAVMDMGFDRELVREASRLRIDAGNGAYENTITLLEAVLALDNNTEEQNQTSNVEQNKNENTKPAMTVEPHSVLSKENEEAASSKDSEKNLKLQLQQILDERVCKVCLDRDAVMLFVPCNHLCCCMDCTQSLRRCPICRSVIEQAIRTYTS